MLLNYHIWDNVITYICFFESVYILISTAIFMGSSSNGYDRKPRFL